MAQIQVFKREQALAKRAQQATQKPAQTQPQPTPATNEPDQPGIFSRMGSYMADKLKPQQTIDTTPRTPGPPMMPMTQQPMDPKKRSAMRFKSPIYG